MSEGHDEEVIREGTLFDRTLLRRILAYAMPHKGLLILSILAILGLTAATIAIPFHIREAIDTHLNLADPTVSNEQRVDGLARASLFIGILALAVFVFRSIQGYLMAWLGQVVVNEMREVVFSKIMRLPLAFFDRNRVGRLLTRATSDLDSLQQFVQRGLVGVGANVFMLLGIIIYTIILDWRFAFSIFTIFPVLVFLLAHVNKRTRIAHRKVRTAQSAVNGVLQESISGVRTIQLFNRENERFEAFRSEDQKLLTHHEQGILWNSFYFPTIEVLRAAANILILLAGGWFIPSGLSTVGTLIAFLFFIRYFFRPLEELSDQSLLLQTAMVSAERVFTLLDEPQSIEDPPHPASIEHFAGEIEFKNVTFSYGNEPVLKNLSFHIRPGETAALVGATGSGKTSIISLIARFYDVKQGEVWVDGRNVKEYAQVDLRRRIGIVQQDPVIFSGTLADNIGLHNPAITRAHIEQAARYVNAHEFIARLPEGYDTATGERGANLSTGQKQLIALARAFVQNPDILLILDEATANIDTETEQLIKGAMARLMKNRTTIIIAHRLSTIRDAGQILVLRRGELIEQGTHDQLFQLQGYYHTLCQLMAHRPA